MKGNIRAFERQIIEFQKEQEMLRKANEQEIASEKARKKVAVNNSKELIGKYNLIQKLIKLMKKILIQQ